MQLGCVEHCSNIMIAEDICSFNSGINNHNVAHIKSLLHHYFQWSGWYTHTEQENHFICLYVS